MNAGERLERATEAVDRSVRPLADFASRGSVARAVRWAESGLGVLILALFGFGVVMLATMLLWGYVAAGVVVLAVVPWALGGLARRSRPLHVLLVTPVAVAVSILGLLGFDVLWAAARIPRPSPAVGLVVAGFVVAWIAYGYLRWVGKPGPPHHWLWAVYCVLAAVGLAALTGQGRTLEPKLVFTAAATGVAIWVYLGQEAGPQIRHPLWWALLLVGGVVIAPPLLVEAIQGGRVSRPLLGAGLLVAVAGGVNALWTPAGSERLRHARRVFAVALAGIAIPLLTLIFIRAASLTPSAPHEEILPVAAATSPLPQAAFDHRPILLFDGDEQLRTPIDVDRMLATGDVELCPEGDGLLAHCRAVNSAADLRNGFGNLRFDSQRISDDVLPTTIYAHAVPDRTHQGWTDIDYWWYLPDNPANTAQGAMCGAGLVIPEITCFDHQSDWEGATVVVDEGQDPVAVHYAAHNHVIDVPWSTLQAAVKERGLQSYAPGQDVADRPLVFVARGTHAAYPLPCHASSCNGDSVFEDNRHDGAHPWPESPCSGTDCVTAFPQPVSGSGDASWNAFDGHWGSAVCLVGDLYCARSDAPRAPGSQGRYRRPWCYDFAVTNDIRRPRPVKRLPECTG
jgi:hypothetical protein